MAATDGYEWRYVPAASTGAIPTNGGVCVFAAVSRERFLREIRLCARLEGMLTDPVYEGKSMAALIDLVRSGRIAPGSRVLYAHLGGQPALNAYAGAF